MVESMPLPNETVTSLAMALVESSKAPLLLLDDQVVVIGASTSFCNTFNLDPATMNWGVKATKKKIVFGFTAVTANVPQNAVAGRIAFGGEPSSFAGFAVTIAYSPIVTR